MSEIETRIVNTPISIDEWMRYPPRDSDGAQVFFTGTVRSLNLGRKVVAISYDAFQPLAEATLKKIGEEALGKWPALTVRIVHRIGRLQVGELSVAIFISSPHRDEAFRASRYVIEEIKKRAPIWKKEYYTDGESEWLQGHALCGSESGDKNEFNL